MSHWWDKGRGPVAGSGFTAIGGKPGPEPSLSLTPYLLYETRYDGNAATPDGTKVTASGTAVSSWVDDGSVGGDATQSTASRKPDWTPGVFNDGTVAGLDFSVGGATCCYLQYGVAQSAGLADRQWYMAWALKATQNGNTWLNRKNSTDGMALESSTIKVEINNNGFSHDIGDGTSGLSGPQIAAEPCIVIVRAASSAAGNIRYYLYMGNTSDTGSALVDCTLSTPYQDNDTFDFLGIGTDQSTDRTNYIVGAHLYVEKRPPTDYEGEPSVDDADVQDIFNYLSYHYLDS